MVDETRLAPVAVHWAVGVVREIGGRIGAIVIVLPPVGVVGRPTLGRGSAREVVGSPALSVVPIAPKIVGHRGLQALRDVRLRCKRHADKRALAQQWPRFLYQMFPAQPHSSSRNAITAVRLALYILALGSVAVMLAAAQYKTFDLDRYFVAKELVLHICAASAAVLCVLRCQRLAFTKI